MIISTRRRNSDRQTENVFPVRAGLIRRLWVTGDREYLKHCHSVTVVTRHSLSVILPLPLVHSFPLVQQRASSYFTC
jgi:hypothetical protein